jgi:hypothetical protein
VLLHRVESIGCYSLLIELLFMPKGVYKGKRVAATLPQSLYDVIHNLAIKESRSDSQQIMQLCREALEVRGINVEISD